MPICKDKNKLTGKQERFIAEYLTSNNGTQSIYAAGYKVKDDNSAGVLANTMLSNIKIKQAIDAQKAELAVKYEHNRDIAISLLHEAMDIARRKGDNQGIVSATRELNAITGLHDAGSITINTNVEHTTSYDEQEVLRKRLERLDRMGSLQSAIDKE